MNLDSIIKNRYSCRSYDPDRPVSKEDLLALTEAARLAPSACNSQTWRFIAVTDREMIKRLCTQARGPVLKNTFMNDAPLVIVGCSQLDIVANRIGSAVTGIEYYRIDMGIAMEHMVLKATELGLGTCWIGWFNGKRVAKMLGIPRRIKVLSLLTVGYAKDEAPKNRPRKEIDNILFMEKWGG
jgi:nitroreductase